MMIKIVSAHGIFTVILNFYSSGKFGHHLLVAVWLKIVKKTAPVEYNITLSLIGPINDVSILVANQCVAFRDLWFSTLEYSFKHQCNKMKQCHRYWPY